MASDYLTMNNENPDLVCAEHPKTCLPFMASVFGIPIVILNIWLYLTVVVFSTSTQNSALSTKHSALNTQYSVLST